PRGQGAGADACVAVQVAVPDQHVPRDPDAAQQMLAANENRNLSPDQQEWASTIHAAGCDLLALINQILDLSKVEAGRIETHPEPVELPSIADFAERNFRALALQRGLEFSIEIAPALPEAVTTDRQLLEQILKNLLSNAFKFTERGKVSLRIESPPP